MRDLHRLASSALLVAVACNEALGIEPGRLGNFESGGGGARGGVAGASAEGGVAAQPSGGQPSGGSGATGGEAGTAAGNRGGTGASIGEGGEAGAGPDACSSATDCKDKGFDAPYICQNGRCIDITTDDCDVVIGAEWIGTSPEVEPFIVGAYARFDTRDVEKELFYWSIKLALKEFNDYGPIPIAGVERRPLVLLCHGPLVASDFTPVYRSLDHMIDTVGVSGIFMLTSRAELLTAAERTYRDRHADVFMIDFAGANAELLALKDEGLLWHMLGDPSLTALTYTPLVKRAEDHVNPGAYRGDSDHPTRLAMLVPPVINGYWEYVLAAVAANVRINGGLASLQPENFRNFPFTSAPSVAEEIAAFEPDIVVDFSRGASTRSEIDAAMLRRSANPPFYVLAPPYPPLLDEVSADASLRTRVVGTNYASAEDSHVYDAAVARLQEIAPAEMDLSGINNLYDPMYFLLYAAVAGGVGGHNMERGFERLLSGQRALEMGPNDIGAVLRRLEDPDATLILIGTLGAPQFFLSNGGRYAGSSVWCIDEDLRYEFDVLHFNLRNIQAEELTGTFPCFDF